MHLSEASHCVKGNHLLAFHQIVECVREGGTTRQGHMGSWPRLLDDCLHVADFAFTPASTITSHIKVTTVLLHCVSSAASCRELFNNWGTLLSRRLCCA